MNPFSAMYGASSAVRNRLYDRGILHTHKLSKPVISVGNISLGGSGKTPFVILLGELLKKRGITFDVLSRGYGRETRGVLAVDPNGSPQKFGDEPLLISKRLGCPVIVGESRYHAGLFAEKNFDCTFHILDDGFQHRSLARDFDIVLLPSEDLHDQLLPTGRLREPLSSLHRPDAIVLTEDVDHRLLPPGVRVWRIKRTLTLTPQIVTKNPVVFCAIARPQRFVEQLRNAGIHPVAQKFYRDHHRYTSGDIRDLLALRYHHQAGGFITTQKDLINLGESYVQLAPISFPPVQMELTDPPDALDTMLRIVAERRAGA